MANMAAHPLRERLAHEVHARPPTPLAAPARISHVAVLTGEGAAVQERARIAAFASARALPGPQDDARHALIDAGPYQARWEGHAEFCTYTIVRPGPFDDGFADPALAAAPPELWREAPGALLVGLHMAVLGPDADADAAALRAFGQTELVRASALDGAVDVITDFRLHGDGFARILLVVRRDDPHLAARAVQKILEIETYRMMALLALPEAMQAHHKLSDLEGRVAAASDQLAASADQAGAADRALFDAFTALSAEAEALAASNAYRFAASRAYFGIVAERIAALRERPLGGAMGVGAFLDRRLAPAMRTVDATAERQEALLRRLARASELLRTRVEVAMLAQNANLLQSMDTRAKLQLRLQETVEGLSVVAVSYYALGLVNYVAKAAHEAGMAINAGLATGIAAPFVIGAVFLGIRRIRRGLTD